MDMPRNSAKLANPYIEFEYCYYIVMFHPIIDGVILSYCVTSASRLPCVILDNCNRKRGD